MHGMPHKDIAHIMKLNHETRKLSEEMSHHMKAYQKPMPPQAIQCMVNEQLDVRDKATAEQLDVLTGKLDGIMANKDKSDEIAQEEMRQLVREELGKGHGDLKRDIMEALSPEIDAGDIGGSPADHPLPQEVEIDVDYGRIEELIDNMIDRSDNAQTVELEDLKKRLDNVVKHEDIKRLVEELTKNRPQEKAHVDYRETINDAVNSAIQERVEVKVPIQMETYIKTIEKLLDAEATTWEHRDKQYTNQMNILEGKLNAAITRKKQEAKSDNPATAAMAKQHVSHLKDAVDELPMNNPLLKSLQTKIDATGVQAAAINRNAEEMNKLMKEYRSTYVTKVQLKEDLKVFDSGLRTLANLEHNLGMARSAQTDILSKEIKGLKQPDAMTSASILWQAAKAKNDFGAKKMEIADAYDRSNVSIAALEKSMQQLIQSNRSESNENMIKSLTLKVAQHADTTFKATEMNKNAIESYLSQLQTSLQGMGALTGGLEKTQKNIADVTSDIGKMQTDLKTMTSAAQSMSGKQAALTKAHEEGKTDLKSRLGHMKANMKRIEDSLITQGQITQIHTVLNQLSHGSEGLRAAPSMRRRNFPCQTVSC